MTPDRALMLNQLVNDTWKQAADFQSTESRSHAVVGLSTEAGELLSAMKKVWFYNQQPDMYNIREELGDILYYFAVCCKAFGINTDDLITDLNAKLRTRYPQGYTDQAAAVRADKQA